MSFSTPLPPVASLWVGGELNWLHKLCLASYAYRGHEVVLFFMADTAPSVPPGVRTAPITDIWDPAPAGHADAPASMLSDLFRLHLLKKTDMVWIDTDMLAVRPMPTADYHFGFEPTGSINGAVLRLPKASKALNKLLEWFDDPEWITPWLGEKDQAEIAKAPPGKRLLRAFELRRPAVGPRALAYTLRKCGELKHAQKPDVFYPLRGVMTDVLFSGHCHQDNWLTENTLAVHLYDSMVRLYHKRHRPQKHSFIARTAHQIGFDLSGLKHQKQGNL
ncbi:hypothetical protein TRL7639_00153 [Falsiruegeria litorea R37]|uniref:Galactosyl transferase GMA12/MNN10 family protein n=1 Tax=Falsiruegeria litorea R37 TaxID=1200284 RepID=A0A1Y5RB45_9RHOB|nr:hypothetical protein [Falsiruegeria litorea]SLN12968.1 hypothetical protein TRL7639_00153 [Falsiruegeria litorea R37]